MRARDTKLGTYLEKRTAYDQDNGDEEHEFTFQIQENDSAPIDVHGTAEEILEIVKKLQNDLSLCLAIVDLHIGEQNAKTVFPGSRRVATGKPK